MTEQDATETSQERQNVFYCEKCTPDLKDGGRTTYDMTCKKCDRLFCPHVQPYRMSGIVDECHFCEPTFKAVAVHNIPHGMKVVGSAEGAIISFTCNGKTTHVCARVHYGFNRCAFGIYEDSLIKVFTREFAISFNPANNTYTVKRHEGMLPKYCTPEQWGVKFPATFAIPQPGAVFVVDEDAVDK